LKAPVKGGKKGNIFPFTQKPDKKKWRPFLLLPSYTKKKEEGGAR